MQADQAIYRSPKVIGIFVVLILGAFYWFQYRPSAIKQHCYTQTFANQQEWVKQAGFGADESLKGTYDACLASQGL